MACISSLTVNGGGRAVVLLIPGRKMRSYLRTSVYWCVHTHVEYFFLEVGKPMNSRKHIFSPRICQCFLGPWRGTKHLVLTINALQRANPRFPLCRTWGTQGPQGLHPSLACLPNTGGLYPLRHKGCKPSF